MCRGFHFASFHSPEHLCCFLPPSAGGEMPSCFVAFLCFVMDALRIGPPWDTIRWTDWEGTGLWGCFPLAGSCTCFNCWLHQAPTWIKRVIFHWRTTCWSHATHHFSCHPISLVHTVCAPISISCSLLLSCSLFLYDVCWRYSSPPSLYPWIKCHGLTNCSFQGLAKTTSKMVSLTSVLYLSTINNVAVKHVRRVMPYIQSHLVAWLQSGTLNLTFSVFGLLNHSTWKLFNICPVSQQWPQCNIKTLRQVSATVLVWSILPYNFQTTTQQHNS